MKSRQVFVKVVVAGVVGLVAPGLVHAEAPGAPASGGSLGAPGPESKLWIGGDFGVSPVGTLKASAQGQSSSLDSATAFGIGGLIDYHVTPIISVGFAPNLLFNVKATSDNDSGSELDLPIRVSAGGDVAPKVRLYGFLAPGYSIYFPPSNGQGDIGHPSGFMLGLGGGAGFQVAPKVMLTGELGYQFRFSSVNFAGTDISLQINYLTFAAGAVFAIN
jgi:hypothetical protein